MANARKGDKTAVLMNIAALAISFVLLAAMTFAWFVNSLNKPATQAINVGKFEIALTDNGAQTEISKELIAIEAAYPKTRAQAAAEAGTGAVYAFSVVNTGTVSAQFRLSALVRSDTAYARLNSPDYAEPNPDDPLRPLSAQIRYLVRMSADKNDLPAWKASDSETDWTDRTAQGGGLLFSPPGTEGGASVPDPNNVSLKRFFNRTLLEEASPGEFVGTDLGVLVPEGMTGNRAVYFELTVWLDETATVASTGASTTDRSNAPELTFVLRLDARQAGGGAAFTATELADGLSDGVPIPAGEPAA